MNIVTDSDPEVTTKVLSDLEIKLPSKGRHHLEVQADPRAEINVTPVMFQAGVSLRAEIWRLPPKGSIRFQQN